MTTLSDTEAPDADAPVRLRATVYRALAAEMGARTVVACAAMHGMSRQALFRLLSGASTATLDVAMRMARDLGVSVEDLFEPRPSSRRAKRGPR